MTGLLKLNLGCGNDRRPGYVNVDKFGTPDMLWDLEVFPWPWETHGVEEVLLHHVLEHLGQTPQQFLGIMKELYRVCASGARIEIRVPHPRHDDFLSDPTHVRAVTPRILSLFSKAKNREWIEKGEPNSPLALYLDVDFEASEVLHVLEEPWGTEFQTGRISTEEASEAMRKFNNVVKEIKIVLKVVKGQG
jgi:hypothetical protein